ncbi:MAG: DUF5916 domain-containing protein [Gemmatimonadaceae bacterium]
MRCVVVAVVTLDALRMTAAAQGISAATSAATAAPRSVRARPDSVGVRHSAIVVDGRLDDMAWTSAARATDFVQQRPAPGKPSLRPSEARIWLDGSALYVAMRLYDASDSIEAPIARRDADVYSDWAFVFIDSYDDRRSAFHFAVNPRGVQRDAQVTNDEEWQQDYGWNAVWQSETARDSLGWTAEFRIPLSQLRFATNSGSASTWGIEFGRHIARHNERSYWAPVLPDRPGFVSQFGRLTEVTLNATPRRFELTPYTLAQVTSRDMETANPRARSRIPLATVGADAKWGLTPDFTLTATLNPDFGQVESDPSEVNLTANESFFREQRPFFLEGAELFNFPLSTTGWIFGPSQLFYSRRISRAPQGDDPASARFVDRPAATDLLGAVKVTGKTQSGWSLGVLTALTDQMRANVEFEDGSRDRVIVEPLTQYSMARLQKDFVGGDSYVGATATSVLRDNSGLQLRNSALVGGMDFRHNFANRRYRLAGYLLGSTVRGSEAAIAATQRSSVHYYQRPDADHLAVDSTRTSLNGVAAELRLTKISGTLRWGSSAHVLSSGFEANDLGFHGRSDMFQTAGWIGRNWFDGPRGVRNWEAWFNWWGGWTLGGQREKVGHSIFTSAELESFWNIDAAIEHHLPGLAVTALRGGPALYTPRRISGFASITTDSRRSTVARLAFNGGRDIGDVGSSLNVLAQVTQRIADRAQVLLSPGVMWWRSPQQFVEHVDAHYVVGDVRQTTASLTARVDYSFTPRLSLQLYAQPFLSAGAYNRLGEVVNAHSRSAANRVHRFTPGERSSLDFANPDFAFNELRTNSVVRWEYRPGSTIFLVWSHGRSADGEGEPQAFDWRRQARELRQTRGDHVFLLKLSHWLGR